MNATSGGEFVLTGSYRYLPSDGVSVTLNGTAVGVQLLGVNATAVRCALLSNVSSGVYSVELVVTVDPYAAPVPIGLLQVGTC